MAFRVILAVGLTGQCALDFALICERNKLKQAKIVRELIEKWIEENRHLLDVSVK